jgi:hypothetical protein
MFVLQKYFSAVYLETVYTTLIVPVATCKNEKVINKYIDSKFIFYISFSDNPEALINAVFLNNGTYFGLRGRQDHVNMTWGDTRNSCPTKEGQWIVMFVLQKYFSVVYHPMS